MHTNTIESLCRLRLGIATLGAVEAPINNDYRGALLTHALNLTQAPRPSCCWNNPWTV